MKTIDLHQTVWQQLLARRARLPHALLLCGQQGIGKFDLAVAFAASLLCERLPVTGEACGQCLACGWLAQGNHPDLRLLQPQALAPTADDAGEGEDAKGTKKPSQQITIDQVRALDDFLHVGTHRHGARVLLLNPAEAMNRATANALLKSLEEPIVSTLFILVSSNPNRLLPTIRSRCQTVSVPLPPRAIAVAWLRDAGVAEPDDWLALAAGAPLLALALSSSGERTVLEALLAEVSSGAGVDPLAAAARLERVVKADKRPAPLKRLLEWAQKWLFDLNLATEALPPRYFLRQAELLQELAQGTDRLRLLAFNRKALQYKAQCDQPLNSRLFLEDFFLGYARVFQSA
ncbi:MAG TPA: DNA polymerase III subunit delta' [Candidatus Accumulibacter phosphatis]|nr:MAG: DNA polymerase III subunit delta' [Candidatus Accumulibacter sp. SK-11]HAY28489.1 DNA polymerase III subunit delta' [Accumulibacter sp.]HCN69009.1 DNA polymerase III subunit delta' [Accumulibacter sp.]HRL77808.1 DNA polymerase III subunit delta' [Candidatus Accumulibacter phosphatis]HRQ96382.1 DNA polymerase III subunit delta' [Candidatus Accumulibacter phosphatis]